MDCVWVRRSRPVSLIYSTSHGRLWTETERPTLCPVLAIWTVLPGHCLDAVVGLDGAWSRQIRGLFGSGPTVAVGLHSTVCVFAGTEQLRP